MIKHVKQTDFGLVEVDPSSLPEGTRYFTYEDSPPSYNPRTQNLNSEFIITSDSVALQYTVTDKTPEERAEELNSFKESKISQISRARWEEEVAPFFFASKNARFDTSERSQVKYLQAAQMDKQVDWKTYSGWVTMSQIDFVDLIESYQTFVKDLFEKEKSLTNQILNANSYEAVEAVKW